MAIRGDLGEAVLPEVLQLLALGHKTGCLSVARPGNFGSIYFERGRIAYVTLVNRRERLGEALVKSGAVDAADLRAALAEQTADAAQRLGDLLVRRGALTREALDRHVRAQVEEAALELLTWTSGTFNFEPDVRVDTRDHVVSIDPGSLLLEGARRADEWQLIRASVPETDLVFALAEGALGTVEGADEVGGFELSAEQRRALGHVDGRRDIVRVADDAGVSEFDVARALHALANAGLARRVGRTPPADAARAPRVDEHRNLGVAFYAAGLHDEAAREFRRVVELVPGDGQAHFYLGTIAARAGQWSQAAVALREAVAAPGAPAAAQHNLAVVCVNTGDWDGAEGALGASRGATSLGAAGDDDRAAVVRARCRLARGEVAAALDALNAAAPDGGRDAARLPVWYHTMVLAHVAAGQQVAALDWLERGVRAHPRSGALLACLASVRARAGQDAEALRLADRAAAEEPSLPQPLKVIGDVHYRAGRHAAAAAAYARAVELDPSLGPDVWLKLGNVRLRDGDRAGAADAWGRALSLQPDHAIARANLDALGALGVA